MAAKSVAICGYRSSSRVAAQAAGGVAATLAEAQQYKWKTADVHSLASSCEQHGVVDGPEKCRWHDHGSSSSASLVDRLVERGSDHLDSWSSTRLRDRWSFDLARRRLGEC